MIHIHTVPVPLQVQKTETKPMIIPRRKDKAIYKKTNPNPNTKANKLDRKTCDQNYKAQKALFLMTGKDCENLTLP